MNGIYQTCYELISTYVFGAVQSGTYEDLIAKLIATIGSLFVVALPFIVVMFVVISICKAFWHFWG